MVTISLWSLKAKLFRKLILSIKNIYVLSFFYYTISQACYFTQGNSNSLSTLQVSSSLVGLNEFNQFISAFLLFTATYASQIYWFCNLVQNLSIIKTYVSVLLGRGVGICFFKKKKNLLIFRKTGFDYGRIIDLKLIMTSIITLVYTNCAFIQREHLFIWTVFAPKLVYQLFSIILELFLYTVYNLFDN